MASPSALAPNKRVRLSFEVLKPGIDFSPLAMKVLNGILRAERNYSTFEVRKGGHEETPLIQGKEQRLRFAGAAVKSYPMSKVRETQVRQ